MPRHRSCEVPRACYAPEEHKMRGEKLQGLALVVFGKNNG